MGIYTSKYKVLFEDTDKNLEIKNTVLMRYLIDSAGMHSEQAGYGISNVQKTHIVFLLTGWQVKILKHPKLLDEVIVKTWPETLSHSLSTRNFEVYVQDELVALASTKWIMVNSETHAVMSVTEEITNAYGPIKQAVFDKPIPKLQIPDYFDDSYDYIIKRRDIDSNNHVNNLNYLDIACEAFPDDIWKLNTCDEFEILYKHQIKLDDKIVAHYSFENDTNYIVVKSADGKVLHSIMKFC